MEKFTKEEIEAAQKTRDVIIESDEDSLKSVYMAGEIVMWKELQHLQEADRIIRALAKAESVDFTWILAAQNYVANNPEK